MLALTGAILIVAPPSLHRQGLLLTLQQAWPGLDFILTADLGQVPNLLRSQSYRLVVVDALLPDSPLTTLLERLLTARSNQQLLLLTGSRLSAVLRHSLQTMHHLALLSRHSAPEALLDTIEHLLGGSSGGRQAQTILPTRTAGPPTPFTRRELEVLRLVMADYSNQEIAEQLFLSVRTVESHRRALLQKVGAKTLVGLVVQAVRKGWIAA